MDSKMTEPGLNIELQRSVRPRQYQWEIFETARKERVIAYLDTGSGKTLISILLIRDRFQQLQERSIDKQIFFLAPKVGLVKQQANVLREHLELEVGDFCGDMNIDGWTFNRWRNVFREKDVIVCTPAILLSLLRRSFLQMTEIDLIVFDECHHCKKGDPYNCIMQEWYFDPKMKASERPHILGLTASPLDTKSVIREEHVQQFFRELERNLDCRIITVRSQDEVREAAPLPTSRTEYYSALKPPPGSPSYKFLDVLQRIHRLLREERLARQNEMRQATRVWMAEDGKWLDHDLPTSETAIFEQLIGRIIHAFEEVGGYGALVAFSEMLRPSSRNIYVEINKASKHQQETLATLRARNLSMTPEDESDESWWQGAGGALAGMESSRKVEIGQKEERSLCHILSFAHNQLVEFMDAVAVPGLPKIDEKEAMELQWGGLKKHLRKELANFEQLIPRDRLVSELMESNRDKYWGALVTPKAGKMVQVLSKYEAQGDADSQMNTKGWSCIIFAEQKVACMALSRLLKVCAEGLQFVRVADLMGSGDRAPALSHSTALQGDTLAKFKSGEYNVMVATSVAEEGLDNCHCSLIVRWTLPKTACQFIQSRGRARARGSEMVLMCEKADASQGKFVSDLARFEQVMLTEAQARAKLPNPARDYIEDISERDAKMLPISEAEYRIPLTGARVSISGAKSLLFQYCSKLPSDCYTGDLRPRFSTVNRGVADFVTTVYLPNNAHAKKAVGKPRRTRTSAISAGCLEAIAQLHQAGGFNDYLVPISHELEPEDDEFHLGPIGALRESAATRLCKITPKWPELLKRDSSHPNSISHLYRVKLESVQSSEERAQEDFWRQTLGVLVPNRLPDLPPITPFIDDQKQVKVQLSFEYVAELNLEADQMRMIMRYHNILQHRSFSVEDLCQQRLPGAERGMNKKNRGKRDRQRFQGVDAKSGRIDSMDAPIWSHRETLPQTHFYEDALSTAKRYAEMHGMMPRDPMEEAIAKAAGASYNPNAETLDKQQALATGMYRLYRHAESSLEEVGPNGQLPTKKERKEQAYRDRYKEETFVEDSEETESEAQEQKRLIEDCSNLPSAGAVVIPLTATASMSWEPDWPAIKFAFEPPKDVAELTDEELQDCLVAPIYIPAPFQKVIQRRHDLTPQSSTMLPGHPGSPARLDETFAQRIRRKYHIQISALDSKMIAVTSFRASTKSQGSIYAPELCILHPLKLPAYSMAQYVPRILWWLHALLQGAELRQKLLECKPDYPAPTILSITECIVSKSCDTEFNYERLEIIGDAFLKFDASLHCFRAFPASHEGQLHNVKIKLVCNKHLAKIALELLELDKYIIAPASAFRWDAGHCLPVCTVKRKAVADVLEALIGAYFMASGIEGCSDFLRHIMLLPQETRHPQPRPASARPASAGMASKVEALLQYNFEHLSLLREACTHPSWKEDNCPSYERLEFLGDAIIDVYVVKSLAERYQDISPGMVSDIREAAVNNTRLACVAAAHRCHYALRHASDALLRDVGNFVRYFDETLRQNTDPELLARHTKNVKADSEALGKTYDKLTDDSYGLKLASAPKVLADLVESLVGAVYIDAGCNLQPAFKVLDNIMDPLPKPETVPLHPVRILVEKTFSRGFIMKFNIRKGSDHNYHVDAYVNLYLLASAEGYASRKSGKIMAARKAIERWSDDVDYSNMPGQAFDVEKAPLAAAFAAAVRKERPDLLTAGPGRINLSYEERAMRSNVKILAMSNGSPIKDLSTSNNLQTMSVEA